MIAVTYVCPPCQSKTGKAVGCKCLVSTFAEGWERVPVRLASCSISFHLAASTNDAIMFVLRSLYLVHCSGKNVM